MKARVKKTDEIVEAYPIENIYYEIGNPTTNRVFEKRELELLTETRTDNFKGTNNTDWNALRNQAAIAAMQGTITMLSGDCSAFEYVVAKGYSGNSKKTYPNEIAEFAVACADALIEELKKK